jgi:transposase-like protein/ribosomal protein L37AE/L43A
MEDYPRAILDFEKRFSTEEACREYLAKLRWPDGFRCPRCNHDKSWHMERGVYWCHKCSYQVSVTAGTIFQDSRKPLMLWFRAIWYVVSQKNGVSALGLQRVLGIGSYRTAWTWLHKLRCAMVRPGRDKLSGVIEVDETYIGGRKPGKRGRGAEGKSLVAVAVEDKGKHFGRIRLCRIANASADSLIPAVQESVEPGSVVRTDGWKGYVQLPSKGYQHTVVRHSANVGDNLLPLASQVTGLLKKWLLGTHQGAAQPSHLDYYLDEFTFRFNRRTSHFRGKLFYRLLEQAVIIPPVTGQDIRGGRMIF